MATRLSRSRLAAGGARRRGVPPRRVAIGILAGLSVAALAAGCGQAGSSGTKKETNVKGAGCAPVAGSQLVVLKDDKHLQNSDNIVPAVNAKVASPALIADLNKVSAALDTPKLIQLNKQADVDRVPPQKVAAGFAKTANLTDGVQKGSGSVTIGAANFSESKTLAYLYKTVLDAGGFTTSVRTIGNRELYEPALEKGEIQVVPEYAATLTEFLNQKANGKNAKPMASPDIDTTMKALTSLGAKDGLKFGEPSAAADENAFGVTKEFAEKNKVSTLSEFAAKCNGKATILGGPPECPDRAFCEQGLESKYGMKFGKFVQLDAGGSQSKNGLKTGKVSISLLLSSDAALAGS
ncbi:glycine betaine ABC transporter substrate-binding protein [Actinocatenispora sera]|uniref:glycine betaine ABC transporter substrate-binding protein n=1 Tax=Actinocatenispora sera TaxID=390989 RepID=UPI0033DE3EA0